MAKVVRKTLPQNVYHRKIKRKAPIIFKTLGLITLVGSQVVTTIGTVRAVRAVDKRKEELGVEKLPAKEVVKVAWPYYIPTVAITGGSAYSFLKTDSLRGKESAALAAAYTAAEKTLAEFKQKTVEKIGEDKVKEISTEVYQDQANEIITSENHYIQTRNAGDTLFYEPMTGTFFYSTPEKVRTAFIKLTEELQRSDSATLSDLFYLLDLRPGDVCNMIGWHIERNKVIRMENCHGVFDDGEGNLKYWIIEYSQIPLPL